MTLERHHLANELSAVLHQQSNIMELTSCIRPR